MYVKQNLSILFYLKRKKITEDGKAPIYVRVTIDDLEDEISLGIKVLPEHWDNKTKSVHPSLLIWEGGLYFPLRFTKQQSGK